MLAVLLHLNLIVDSVVVVNHLVLSTPDECLNGFLHWTLFIW